MPTVLEKAQAELAKAEYEVQRLKWFIENYKRLESGDMITEDAPIKSTKSIIDQAITNKMTPTEILARQVIIEAGRPVMYKEMYNKLMEKGLKIEGKDPLNSMRARLSRADSIYYLSRGGWTIRDETTNQLRSDPVVEHEETPVQDAETPVQSAT